jgi:hypothetical protein
VSCAFGALIALTSGCHRRESKPSPPVLTLAPERPASVVAELTVPRPLETWQVATGFAGPIAALLPKSPELALGAWLGLPPLSATRLDLRTPLVAALVDSPEPASVIGVHVASGSEFVADLTTGAEASRKLESNQGLRLLTSLEPDRPLLGVVDDVVLVGPRAALLAAGPYVARALLRNANASGPLTVLVPGRALREQLVPLARATWNERRAWLARARASEQQARGRAPDFGDPDAILGGIDRGMNDVLAALAAADRVTGELSLSSDRLETRWCVWPAKNAAGQVNQAEMALAPGDALGVLPANTALALLLARPAHGKVDVSAAVRSIYGSRLNAADEHAVGEALSALDSGLGGAQVLALLDDKSVVWRGEVADSAPLRRGLGDALSLLNRKSVVAPVTAFFGSPSVRQSAAKPGVSAGVDRASISLMPAPGKAGAALAVRRVEVRSVVDSKRFVVAFASGAEPPLDTLLRAEGGTEALASAPATQALLKPLEPSALALFVDLARLGLVQGAPAPLLVNWGSYEGKPALTARLSAASVRALVLLEQSL